MSKVSHHDFPDEWLRTAPGGYGYVQRVPCRVLTQTAKRVKIAAARKDGTWVVRYVKPELVRERLAKDLPAAPETGAGKPGNPCCDGNENA